MIKQGNGTLLGVNVETKLLGVTIETKLGVIEVTEAGEEGIFVDCRPFTGVKATFPRATDLRVMRVEMQRIETKKGEG